MRATTAARRSGGWRRRTASRFATCAPLGAACPPRSCRASRSTRRTTGRAATEESNHAPDERAVGNRRRVAPRQLVQGDRKGARAFRARLDRRISRRRGHGEPAGPADRRQAARTVRHATGASMIDVKREYARLVERLDRVASELERMGEFDMGLLQYRLAKRFHKLTEQMRQLTTDLK